MSVCSATASAKHLLDFKLDKFQTSGTHRGTSRAACVHVWTACMVCSVRTRMLVNCCSSLAAPDVLIAQITFIISYSLNIATEKNKNVCMLWCFLCLFYSSSAVRFHCVA